jgi:hypothetical protein
LSKSSSGNPIEAERRKASSSLSLMLNSPVAVECALLQLAVVVAVVLAFFLPIPAIMLPLMPLPALLLAAAVVSDEAEPPEAVNALNEYGRGGLFLVVASVDGLSLLPLLGPPAAIAGSLGILLLLLVLVVVVLFLPLSNRTRIVVVARPRSHYSSHPNKLEPCQGRRPGES